MKYLVSLAFVVMVGSALCQSTTYEIQEHSGTYATERLSQNDDLRIEEVFWEQDFGGGLPAPWENVNYDENNNLTGAVWEYRGPDSTPDNTMGTIGNCIDAGEVSGPPIQSPTADNGFIIFDSDYWDSSEGDCGDFGTGIAAAPHNATLTTGSFDFTGKPYIGLVFNQYLKNFNSSFRVQASVNGGDYVNLYVNPINGTNASSSPDMQVRKNISEVVGNQPDVKIRFSFEGTYYFWMLDDLQLVLLEENNLEISGTHHGSLDIPTAEDFVNYDGIEYFKYPLSMLNTLETRGNVENRGGVTQNNVNLKTTIWSDGMEINTFSSDPIVMDPEFNFDFEGGIFDLPQEVASYDLVYEAIQDENEESPDNNMVSKRIEVTEFTLAADEGSTDAYYIPDAEFNGMQYEVGTVFVPTEENMQLHSISAGVSSSSLTGSHCYAALYGIEVANGVILEPISNTLPSVVQFFHLNDFGDDQMMVFDFDSPFTLNQDSTYLAVVGTMSGPEEVSFALSGKAQPLTSWAKFADNSIFYLDRTPMVRLNFGLVTTTEEIPSNNLEAKLYPNPASNDVTIEYSLIGSSELIVGLFDIQGKHIENLYVGVQPGGTHQLVVDVSNMPSGAYIIRINSEYGKLEERIVIE